MDPKPNASYGALISIILILAIVVVGAFYVWDQRVSQTGQNVTLPTQTVDETGSSTDASTTQLF
jgi:hypothetical protein